MTNSRSRAATLAVVLAGSVLRLAVHAQTETDLILVDQFGWQANSPSKIAMFADPVQGQNSAASYTPGATFEVRRTSDNVPVYTGATVTWNGGAVQALSGDRVWQADFSPLVTPGEYVIVDPANNVKSHPFALRDDVYNDVLMHASRMFYYNRRGVGIPARYGGLWTHPIDHQQDRTARLFIGNSPQSASTARDVSGGWFDAGNYAKYIDWLDGTMWDLLAAYDLTPAVFTDGNLLPESGNGVPDILDEIRWELDWMMRMQDTDGGAFNRVAANNYESGGDSPDLDVREQFYTPKTTWGTGTLVCTFARAAKSFEPFDPDYASVLEDAALKGWSYLEAHPQMTPADGFDGANLGGTGGGTSTSAQDMQRRIHAAAELYRLTGDTAFRDFFDNHYDDTSYADSGLHPALQDMLDPTNYESLTRGCWTYALTPGATASVVAQIKSWHQHTMDWVIGDAFTSKSDAYLAFMWDGHYSWGSNKAKMDWAMMALMAVHLQIAPANDVAYRAAAQNYLNYLHGRNPLGWVYLTNMGDRGARAGAEKSPMEIYHLWFQDGSARYDGAASLYGPAPGYVPGGPNPNYAGGVTPPTGEPAMKAYRDWNTSWPENSWEVTEPALYYQAAYIFVASHFASSEGPSGVAYVPGAATATSPLNGATGIAAPVTLTWDAGAWSAEFDVLLGTSPNLNQENIISTTSSESFSAAGLLPGTTHYWRIDAKNRRFTTPGTVQSFTTAGNAAIADAMVLY